MTRHSWSSCFRHSHSFIETVTWDGTILRISPDYPVCSVNMWVIKVDLLNMHKHNVQSPVNSVFLARCHAVVCLVFSRPEHLSTIVHRIGSWKQKLIGSNEQWLLHDLLMDLTVASCVCTHACVKMATEWERTTSVYVHMQEYSCLRSPLGKHVVFKHNGRSQVSQGIPYRERHNLKWTIVSGIYIVKIKMLLSLDIQIWHIRVWLLAMFRRLTKI